MLKFSYDGRGINDKTNEYAPRIATFSESYIGRKDIGRLLEAAPELLETLQSVQMTLAGYVKRDIHMQAALDKILATIAKAKGE